MGGSGGAGGSGGGGTCGTGLGTYVGPVGIGAPGNPGTQALPLSTIADAQAKVALMGGGDICLCDTPASGSSDYPGDVTMIEGISVYGGFNCTDWSRAISTYVTTIGGTVDFPAGITSVTALDGLTVIAPNIIYMGGPFPNSTAVSIVNSSPSLIDVSAYAGSSPSSVGLVVRAINGGTASPTVTRGGYYARGIYDLGTSQLAVGLSGASGTFTNVVMSSIGNADYSTGLSCSNCNATLVGGSIGGGSANNESVGISVSGNSGGLSITNTSIKGGYASLTASQSYGVTFSNCNGSPTLSGVNIWGGGGRSGIYGVHAKGAQCAPVISGSTVAVGGAITTSTGVTCTNNSPCVVTNSKITAGGSSWNNAGVYCDAGGCGTLSGNTISAGTIDGTAPVAAGIYVKNANPIVDRNHIAGPACPSGAGPGQSSFAAAYLENSSSSITNNVLYDQPCNYPVNVVILKNAVGAAPMLHNNTIQFSTCNGCGVKRGLFGTGSAAASSVRNNIIINAGTADFANGFAVYEDNASSDLQMFENNALWAPNGGTLYFDEGTTPRSLAAINALMGSGGNINADPQLDATFHIPMTSPCRNAGTAAGAPAFDFDGDTRPQEMSYDIGADEYVP